MESDATGASGQDKDLVSRLFMQCQSLFSYALKEGHTLDDPKLSMLQGNAEDFKGTIDDLFSIYNYLVEVLKPVSPRIALAIEKTEHAPLYIKLLGPLPIVRQFTLLAILSLAAFIVTSLSEDINVKTIQLSILQGCGWGQVQRLIFLISCASVGASFYGLFRINSFLKKGDLDLNLVHTYWSRYVLGIVAGLLLSELFVSLIEPSTESVNHDSPLNSAGFLLKPILAILGGFSADLVYTILSRLVETVESLFKGDSGDILAQKQAAMQVQSDEQAAKLKNATAQQLLDLKGQLLQSGASPEAIDKLNDTVDGVISGKKKSSS